MHFFVAIALPVILILIDLYFFRGVRHFTSKMKPGMRKIIHRVYWGYSVFTVLFMGVAALYYITETPPPSFARTYITGFIFVVLFSKLIGCTFILVSDIKALTESAFRYIKRSFKAGKPINPEAPKMSRGKFLKRTGLVITMAPFSTMMYGMFKSAFNFTVRDVKLNIPDLPEAFTGMKVLQISDIHTGSFISKEPLEEAVKIINEQEADIVFFTGDLVNEVAEEAEPFMEVLERIKAPHGVLSILGNHDYGDYFYGPDDTEGKKHNRELIKTIQKEMGWKLLLNENHVIEKDGEKLAVLGVENWGHSNRFQKYGDISEAKKGVEDIPTKLLLTHDPSHWDAKVTGKHDDIKATFSGHTHGFQFGIEIPGFRWSPSQYLYKQWAGLYQNKRQQIYVNRGLGFLGYPGRVGILPEITLFELNKA